MSTNNINQFNPIKVEETGAKAKRVIWSTESLKLALKGLNEGRRLVANPFYDNKVQLLKADLMFRRTPEEQEEWLKCKDDIIYFVEKYCKLLTPEGIQHVTLRPYQRKYLCHLSDNQLSICLQCRQSGKTTTTSLFMLHYLLFNIDKNALICSNKRKSAVEVVDKVKKIYNEIPYFLKPGIQKWNEAEIVMDNGCRVQAEATTINAGIGDTVHMLLLDEFAHVHPNIIDKFYNNIFPTVSAAKAKVAIISTQNGRNLFYKLYTAAVQHDNDYKAFKVEWRDVPEWDPIKHQWVERDDAWYNRQVANYGSVEALEKQMGTNFDLGSNTLVNQKTMKSVCVTPFVNKDIPGVYLSDCWYWHPNFDPMNLKKEYIVTTCDLAEGANQDYTIFSLYRMVNPGSDDLELIGYFRSNTHPRDACTRSLMNLYIIWINPNTTVLSFERNTYGEVFLKDISDLAGKELPTWDPGVLVKYYTEAGTKYHYGVKITAGNKTAHCVLFKESFERGKVIATAEQFIYELQNFCDDGSGHYKASYGHDDMVMTAIQLEFVKKTLQYKMMREDFDDKVVKEEDPEDTIWNPYDSNSFIPTDLDPFGSKNRLK